MVDTREHKVADRPVARGQSGRAEQLVISQMETSPVAAVCNMVNEL
ncbi:hypothetical protein [Paenibacillus oralis]|nr:hypothetical protein [Paenibacillus oralis]